MTTLSVDAGYIAIPIDHPADPRPGDLCRAGTVAGVMAYNSLYEDVRRQLQEHPALNLPVDLYTGQHEFGEGRKPVSFRPSAHRAGIRNQLNETATPGSIVRYFDCPVGPSGGQAHAVVCEPSARHDAVVGILLEANTSADYRQSAGSDAVRSEGLALAVLPGGGADAGTVRRRVGVQENPDPCTPPIRPPEPGRFD